jgi:acyl carrier protein
VREAVVVAREDEETGDKRLVAYIVGQAGAAAGEGAAQQDETQSQSQQTGVSVQANVSGQSSVSELRSALKERLPEYMIPSSFVFLSELPLTPNGKVDRKALPAPDETRPELASGYVAPRTPLEEALCGIWAEVLRVKRVGVEDNFFELGGHSLLATQLMSRVRETVKVDLMLRSMFEQPTVAGLARYIEQNQGQQNKGIPKIQPRQRGRQNLQHLLAKLEQMAEGDVREHLDDRKPL